MSPYCVCGSQVNDQMLPLADLVVGTRQHILTAGRRAVKHPKTPAVAFIINAWHVCV